MTRPIGRTGQATGRPVVLNGGYTVTTALRTRVAGTSSHCLTVPQGRVRDQGLAMQIVRCNSAPSQTWFLIP